MVTKSNRVGLLSRGELPPLSDALAEVLDLFTIERLTPRQVSIRRKTTPQAVYNIRRKLIKLGVMSKDYKRVSEVTKEGVGSQPISVWELHGCAWRVEIIEGQNEPKYKQLVSSGVPNVRVHSCTVELYRDCLVIYYDGYFRSDSPDGCIVKSWEYLFSVLPTLENDYRLMLRKDRHSNIKRFRGHFPRLNDEGAQRVEGETIRVYAEDGKLRFTVDWSKKKYPEAEFLHSQLGSKDARKYEDFIRDLVERDNLSLSELSLNAAATTAQITALASELRELTRAVKAGQEMQNTILTIIEENYRRRE